MRRLSARVVLLWVVVGFTLGGAVPAFADEIIAVQDIRRVFPSQDVILPQNARPIFLGPSIDGISFVVINADGETTLEHQEEPSRFEEVAYLIDVPLEGREQVTIASRCPTCSEVLTWSVSDALDESPPVFGDGPAELLATGHNGGPLNPFIVGYDVDGRVPPITDEGPLVLRLRGSPELNLFHQVPVGEEAPIISLIVDGGDARRVCATASAIDIAGNETDLADELCVDLDPDVNDGCSQSSAAPLAFMLLTLLTQRRGTRTAGGRTAFPRQLG